MKNWIIKRKEEIYTYFIISEKSIWISEQHKDSNIEELIRNQNLGTVKSFRFDQLKEIILIETNFSIQFKFKDKEEEEQRFTINQNVFGEIRTFLKLNLSGINIKKYSLLRQVIPQLSTLGLGIIFILLTYQSALDLENNIVIPESQKSSIIKK